jgi:hypothetical protein
MFGDDQQASVYWATSLRPQEGLGDFSHVFQVEATAVKLKTVLLYPINVCRIAYERVEASKQRQQTNLSFLHYLFNL